MNRVFTYLVCGASVAKILKAHAIDPSPDRKRTGSWATFLKSHWDVLAAIDFTSVEVWTRHGLVTFYLLFVMELKTRRVHFAGYTTSPGEDWLKQTARELTNHGDGILTGKKYLIMDRDTKFSESFRSFLSNEGVEPVRLPPRSPNMNAYMERFFGWLKSECLDRLILFGGRYLLIGGDLSRDNCLRKSRDNSRICSRILSESSSGFGVIA